MKNYSIHYYDPELLGEAFTVVKGEDPIEARQNFSNDFPTAFILGVAPLEQENEE